MRKLIIVGAGGAGSEALLVARRMGDAWDILGFCDDRPELWGTSFEGAPVLTGVPDTISTHVGQGVSFHCAIGRNDIRMGIARAFEQAAFEPATLIDPSAVVAPTADIQPGCYLAPFAFVGPSARVGRHALVNVSVTIGHNAVVGDYAQLGPGARVCGGAHVGEGAFVGANGVAVPLVSIGPWATLGAASLAVREVPASLTVIGVPAANWSSRPSASSAQTPAPVR